MHKKPFRFAVVGGDVAADWIRFARRVEELGYSSLLMPDRVNMNMAPLTALAIAAGVTTTLRIGSYVFCNEFRHPAVLAKEVATLDLLSGGRFELGLGVGPGPFDFTQLGIPYDSDGTRVGRLEEAIQIIKKLYTEETVNFSGKYYTLTNMRGVTKPHQQPNPPIFLGCSGKRMLTLAGREADMVAINPRWKGRGIDPEDATPEAIVRKLSLLREAAGERFESLELCQPTYYIDVTDSPAPYEPAPGAPIVRRPMRAEQAVEHLLELRENFGYSYIQVYGGQMENFAPVVALLAGK